MCILVHRSLGMEQGCNERAIIQHEQQITINHCRIYKTKRMSMTLSTKVYGVLSFNIDNCGDVQIVPKSVIGLFGMVLGVYYLYYI